MDLTPTEPRAAAQASLPSGIDHALLENDGPTAHGDRMGTPAPDEKVLWKGRPALGLLARSAFHTRTLGLYFAALVIIALATGSNNTAIIVAALGTALIGLLYFLAWLSARSTLYILTDVRLILRIGMAIETRINIPLKQVKAAHLRTRSDGHGDIALELGGERLLGVVLLWPHMRPWQYAHPQPMLRSVPDAASLAQLIAEARSQYGAIDQNLIEIKDAPSAPGHQSADRAIPVARPRAGQGISDQGLEGVPA
ncbi:MAG: photosynthetic complex assembly protein [Alphaproteobacteria bacterium HGW-Alphaproteobacteria-15]|nr:MAG: photosynthetic complex assembly protein [Alphaproteobacteria bacterium HGW-Alphaproteobacteria-15]